MIEVPSIDVACTKYGIDKSLLVGRILRGEHEDPVTVNQLKRGETVDMDHVLILDDWRLHALAADKSGEAHV